MTFPLCWLMDRINAHSRRRQASRRDALRALPNADAWQRLRLRWLDWHLDQMRGLYIAYVLVIFIYGWVFWAPTPAIAWPKANAAMPARRLCG